VREFVDLAASKLGLDLTWEGSGLDEVGYDRNGSPIIRIDPRYFRPTEVDTLLGDSTKAREKLSWSPTISFDDLITEMVDEDLRLAEHQIS
jgi:GDPmannose 4,6-dehydratase